MRNDAQHRGWNLLVARGDDARRLFDARWDALLAAQPSPNPTLCATWLNDAADLDEGEPLTLAVERDGRLLAAGAFALSPWSSRGGRIRANWLGATRPVMVPDLLIDPEEPEVADVIFEALYDHAGVVRLSTFSHGWAAGALRRRAPWLRERQRRAWRECPLPPPNLRRRQQEIAYELRRAARRGARIETAVHEDPDAVAEALERMFVVHRERWKGRDDGSRFSATEELRAWHRRAVRHMAERGAARLTEIVEDGVPVGLTILLLAGRGAALHTTAMRAGGCLRSPGNASFLLAFEAAEKGGAEVMSMGRGGGAHKLRYAFESVPVSYITAARSATAQRWIRFEQRRDRLVKRLTG